MNYKKYLTNAKFASSIRLGVGIIIYASDKLLLERRADCHKWGLIGGGVEVGENVEDAALRECFEETSIKLKKENLEFFNLYSDVNQHRIIQYDDNCFHAIDIIYLYKMLEDNLEIIKSKESLAISFFSFKSLPHDIVPPAIDPIADFIKSEFKL